MKLWLRCRNQRGSLPAAMVLVVVGAVLLTVIALTTITALNKTRVAQGQTEARQAASSAVQTALYGLQAGFTPPAPSAPIAGVSADGSSWSYYGVQSGSTWIVTATGQSALGATSREVATLSQTSGAAFPSAAFANNQLNLQSRNGYIDNSTSDPHNYIGSNGSISLGGTSWSQEFIPGASGYSASGLAPVLANWTADPNPSRCTIPRTACSFPVTHQPARFQTNNAAALAAGVASCGGAGSLTAYSAGTGAPYVNPGTQCYSSFTLNGGGTGSNGAGFSYGDMQVSASHPGVVYVTGNVNITGGAGWAGITPGIATSSGTSPWRLTMVVGGNLTINLQAVAAYDGMVNVAGTCTINTSTFAVEWYGSLTCGNIVVTGTGTSIFYWNPATPASATQFPTVSGASASWTISSVTT